MKVKRFLSVVLAAIMVVVLVPAAALAQGVAAELEETRKLDLLDSMWADLEVVEAQAKAAGASKSEVTLAVYKAALQHELIDENSINSLTVKSFFFTVEGMHCCYDYVARDYDHEAVAEPVYITIPGTKTPTAPISKNGPTSPDVLLVEPYGHSGGGFTDQYVREAQSIAAATGGDLTHIENSAATGPAIAAAASHCGVVIYDSHGTQSGTSSYLCLTTSTGLTSEDFANGWAISPSYIDGRYVQHHCDNELPNSIFWLAICEGMKRQGQGTTGYALLDAGAGCVYGYSQSVTFVGDYMYEATFWTEMKENDATVAEAFNVMIATHGEPDPRGDAWAIVMSPDDPFPANPDSHQNVNCDWQLFGGGDTEPVEIQSWSLSAENLEMLIGSMATIRFERVPDNANQYELVWHSSNENIVTVDGNNRKVTVGAVGIGSASIYCEVFDLNGNRLGTAYCGITVTYDVALSEAAQADGNNLIFASTPEHPWTPTTVDGRNCVKSGGAGVDGVNSTMTLVVNMQAGDTLTFDWKASCEGSSSNPWDNGKFYVNGAQFGQTITGQGTWATVTYTASSAGTYTFSWVYTKDGSVSSNNDCIYVDNVDFSGESTVVIAGDLNNDGQIGVDDALTLLRVVMGLLQNATPEQLAAADANGDGEITLEDALYTLRLAMGIIG